MNDFFKIPLQEKPRILVDRGMFVVNKVGLTDNLAEQKTLAETKGLKDRINMMTFSGNAQILVEARNQGTCEVLADMATHFITWARPEICDTQGFNEWALPMQVSPCQPTNMEDTEKFQVQIQFPWVKEEQWRVRNDGVTLKNMLLNISKLAQ